MDTIFANPRMGINLNNQILFTLNAVFHQNLKTTILLVTLIVATSAGGYAQILTKPKIPPALKQTTSTPAAKKPRPGGQKDIYLPRANTCFENGDYECAKENYKSSQTLTGKDMSVQIKKTEECYKAIITADDYFNDKKYEEAKNRYKIVLSKNPKDSYAKKQYDLCEIQTNASPVKETLRKNVNIADLQENNTITEDDKPQIFSHVEIMPQFPGGDVALIKWLQDNIQYPTIAAEHGIQGRVTLRFVVKPDGSVDQVEIQKSLDPSCDAEALRVVRMMPRWIPGKQNGNPVYVYYSLPVTFHLQK